MREVYSLLYGRQWKPLKKKDKPESLKLTYNDRKTLKRLLGR